MIREVFWQKSEKLHGNFRVEQHNRYFFLFTSFEDKSECNAASYENANNVGDAHQDAHKSVTTHNKILSHSWQKMTDPMWTVVHIMVLLTQNSLISAPFLPNQ